MARLENKVAVVTGAADGIGKCIAERFAAEGATVVALDMAEGSFGHSNIHGFVLNVTDRDGIKACFNKVMETFGKVDILVNNAGITRDALTVKMTEDMWDLVMDVNLKGVFNMTQAFAPQMVENGHGSIINIASVVGEFGNIGQANYAATKAGVYGLTTSWAKEFARKGEAVRVNAISPGYINTAILQTVPEKILDVMRGKTMLGRLGEPEEIANAALFLASDESSYVTGHNLSVNGGMRL